MSVDNTDQISDLYTDSEDAEAGSDEDAAFRGHARLNTSLDESLAGTSLIEESLVGTSLIEESMAGTSLMEAEHANEGTWTDVWRMYLRTSPLRGVHQIVTTPDTSRR